MRFLKINLLAAAILLFLVASANAYRVDFDTTAFGTNINPGDLITINVNLDTEDQSDILTLGVGVLFDTNVFTYRQDLSSTTTYLLYVNAKTPFLQPASTCGGTVPSPTAGDGCPIYPTRSSQVQLDFISSGLTSLLATVATTATDTSPDGPRLVSLVFEATGNGTGAFSFDFDPFFGSAFDLGSGPGVLTLGSGGSVTVPEPSVALLALTAIGTVAAIRRRSSAA